MGTLRAAIVFAAVAAAGPSGAGAQVAPEPPLSRPVLAGAGLGVVGFFAGGLTGVELARNCTSSEFCGLVAAFYGAAVGGTVGLGVGVHLGNRRRGSLPLDVLTGAAIWGAGIGTVNATDANETGMWVAFVAVPIAQLASAIAVERAVGRARARRVGLSVVPDPAGGVLVLGRIALH